MKKKILSILIAVFILLPCLLLTGCFGGSNNIDLRVENGYIQYTTNGTTWENLVELDDLKGSQGVAGREVEFQKTSTHIQWRYKTSNNSDTWKNLVALNDIKGEDLTAEEVTVTYNFNLGESSYSSVNNGILSAFERDGFNVVESKVNEDDTLSLKMSQQSTKGDYFDLYDMKSLGLSNYFFGWYYDDIKVNSLNIVAEDIELTAKWTEDIATICHTLTNQIELTSINNEDSTAWCLIVNGNASVAYDINKLFLNNGKFYTVIGVSSSDDFLDIYLPDSITDENLDLMFSNRYIVGDFRRTYIRTYNEISNLQSENIKVYQLRNYVFIGDEFKQFIYKIDFETNTATLVTTDCTNYRLGHTTVHTMIERFMALNFEGNVEEIRVTGYGFWWMDIDRHAGLIYNTKLNKTTEFNFVVGADVKSIQSVSTRDISEEYREALRDSYYNEGDTWLYINYFVKAAYDANSLIDYPQNEIYPITRVFYYYENEADVPQDGGNYWHYDTDGTTPIIWGSTN